MTDAHRKQHESIWNHRLVVSTGHNRQFKDNKTFVCPKQKQSFRQQKQIWIPMELAAEYNLLNQRITARFVTEMGNKKGYFLHIVT